MHFSAMTLGAFENNFRIVYRLTPTFAFVYSARLFVTAAGTFGVWTPNVLIKYGGYVKKAYYLNLMHHFFLSFKQARVILILKCRLHLNLNGGERFQSACLNINAKYVR